LVALEDVDDLDGDVTSRPVRGHREREALVDRDFDTGRRNDLSGAQQAEPVCELVEELPRVDQASDRVLVEEQHVQAGSIASSGVEASWSGSALSVERVGSMFPLEEMAARLARVRTAMAGTGIGALVVLAPDSQYWLCGLESFISGVLSQALVV